MIWSPSEMPQECSAWTSVILMPSTSTVPPWLAPMMVAPSIPFEPSQAPTSKLVTIFGLHTLAISSASLTWSKWPWVISIRSHLSTFFNASGATGLFITHGSIRTSFHFALRTFHVPCPTQVKLTSALSGMPHSLCGGRTEKPILPQAHGEDADGGQGPQVGKNEPAGLPVEAQEADAKEHKRAPPPALDRAHGHDEDQGQQRQPLVRPDLVRDERAQGEGERHPVRRIPAAAPGGPHRPGGERDRAQVGKQERQRRQVDGRGDRDQTGRRGHLDGLAADHTREQRPYRVVGAVCVV